MADGIARLRKKLATAAAVPPCPVCRQRAPAHLATTLIRVAARASLARTALGAGTRVDGRAARKALADLGLELLQVAERALRPPGARGRRRKGAECRGG